MKRRPPRSTRTDTLFPYTTLFRSANAMADFGADTITIGGESSGAHLAVVTLLRLRDRHGVALSGANLIFGFYDLTLTPSARLFGDDRVAPRTTDLRSYVKAFVPEGDQIGRAHV